MKKTFVLLSVLEKSAKRLKKEKSLNWHQARDEAAKEFGFTNFKNYQNIKKIDIHQYKLSFEILLKKLLSENNISKKRDFVFLFMQNYETPFRDFLSILKQFQESEKDVHYICDRLNLMKNEIQQYLLDDFLSEDGQSEIEMFYQYYIAKDIALNNLSYSINENTLLVDGEYSLTIAFNGEVPDHYKNEPHFEDHTLCGSFEIVVDRNKKITLEDASIGEDEYNGGPFTQEEIEEHYNLFPNERGRFNDILVLNNSGYDQIKRCLSNNERLTGKTLKLAIDLVDVVGDDEQSRFVRNIGVKMKAGHQLDEYEHHILVDVLLLHAQLGS